MAEVAVRLGASEKCLYSGQPEYLAHSTFVFNFRCSSQWLLCRVKEPISKTAKKR